MIVLVGAGAISSSAIFCFMLIYFLPDPFADAGKERPDSREERVVAEKTAPTPPVPAPDPFEQAVAALNDSSLPLTSRREAALALAALGTDDAMMELLLTASSGNSFLKSAIAEALVDFDHPEARRFLEALLKDDDEMVGRAAIRTLASIGDPAALARLTEILLDPERPVSLRTEAALALGRSEHPDAMNLLLHATYEAVEEDDSEPVFHHIVEALAQRSFGEVEDFFAKYLTSMEVQSESRAAVLESLAGGEAGTADFLVGFLGDADPEVRAAAAWSLTITPDLESVGPQVLEALQTEPDAEVRAHLYRALQGQPGLEAQPLLNMIGDESHPAARMAAYDLLASAVGHGATAPAVDFFNISVVPELKQAAAAGEGIHAQLSAIIALRRAGTPEARQALLDISQSAADPRVVEAARAASGSSRSEPYATVP